LLLRRLRQHAPGQREECLVGRASGRQSELRTQLRVPLRRHLANRGQILEQLTLQRAPHLGALLGGPAPRYHAGPLLPRQRLRPRDQLLEACQPRRLGALNPLRPMGQEEIPHPYGHLQPPPQYREHTNPPFISLVPTLRIAEGGQGVRTPPLSTGDWPRG